jgi:hypothetical protein
MFSSKRASLLSQVVTGLKLFQGRLFFKRRKRVASSRKCRVVDFPLPLAEVGEGAWLSAFEHSPFKSQPQRCQGAGENSQDQQGPSRASRVGRTLDRRGSKADAFFRSIPCIPPNCPESYSRDELLKCSAQAHLVALAATSRGLRSASR